MDKKQKYGQFFTTNYAYIMKDLFIPSNVSSIIEPFAGNKDMLKNFNISKYNIEMYDIDPKHKDIIQRNTLINVPDYSNKFIITNPPYLARNKSYDKAVYEMYNQNDLYKCFIVSVINSDVLGGIVIIPLNFWCSIRKNDIKLRKDFLTKFKIIQLNIFEEKVFVDTSYSVCCFQFMVCHNDNATNLKTIIYPKNKEYNFILNDENNYTIGGEIYNLKQDNAIKIERLTKKNISSNYITNIKLFALDSNGKNKIRLKIVSNENIFVDNTKNLSERSFATLLINPKLDDKNQEKIVDDFNIFIKNYREKYNSLFLSNYRESNDIARKRISFSLVFSILNHLIQINNYVSYTNN